MSWLILPIQDNRNSKKLTIEKLSESGLRGCRKFGQALSNDERKIRLDFAFYMGFLDLIWVTSSAENILSGQKKK